MSEGKDRTQRRVYVLPTELVERIVSYQNRNGLASEVEAARRLLDEALKERDTVDNIVQKLYDKFKSCKSVREAAREVIADHPLVVEISFHDTGLVFKLKDQYTVSVDRACRCIIYDESHNILTLNYDERPEWASLEHRIKPTEASKKRNYDLDADIPF